MMSCFFLGNCKISLANLAAWLSNTRIKDLRAWRLLTPSRSAIDQLLKKDGGLQLQQGEVIATYYLDGLAEDIHQTLQAAGRIVHHAGGTDGGGAATTVPTT